MTSPVGLNIDYSRLALIWSIHFTSVVVLCTWGLGSLSRMTIQKGILPKHHILVSVLPQHFYCLKHSIFCFGTDRNKITSYNAQRLKQTSIINLSGHGSSHERTTLGLSATRHPLSMLRSNANVNIKTSEELSERVSSAPLGLNLTEESFDHYHLRGLRAVLKRTIGGSNYVLVQTPHGSTKHPEAYLSGQISPAQVQDGQTRNVSQASGKRFCPQREDSDDGEDEDTPRRKRSRTEKSPPFAKKLACPFHRNDPENHRKHRSCAGPGWTSIHRLKEHILRQHALPTYCPRCLKTFNAETECRLHLRQAVLCPLSDSTPPEGYNKEQGTALRTRSKGNAEPEWKAIYRLLFPGVPEELIPSPYYDDDDTELEKLQRRESNRFQRHMEHAVPRSVSRLLEQTIFELSTSLDVPMRTRLVEIVVRAVAEASQSYRQHESPPTAVQAPVVPNDPSGFTQHPQMPGAPDSMLYQPTPALIHEPVQPQASALQHGGLEHGLDHSTGVYDGNQENDSLPGNELLVDPLLLEMSLFDWNPDQDTLFQDP